jgi:hypothetical protein
MYTVSQAFQADRDESIAFLEQRGLRETFYVIWDVENAFQNPDIYQVLLCRNAADLAGVLTIAYCQKSPEWNPIHDYSVYLDAGDSEALAALLEVLPDGKCAFFFTFRPLIQHYLDALPGITRRESDLFFSVLPETFAPVPSPEVVELTPADSYLFAECEYKRSWEYYGEGARVFAILQNGKVASSVSIGVGMPNRQESPRVIAVGYLFTEVAHRRKGFGRKLVSHFTKIILEAGNIPIYDVEPDNLASQQLAVSLGYRQYAQRIHYVWHKS